ncbi:MAG: hypothetical protein GY854_03260 [Deltaproteobacteria bacterium]|nr:hypothetical protein [Deltaproteobacteria bacterium]
MRPRISHAIFVFVVILCPLIVDCTDTISVDNNPVLSADSSGPDDEGCGKVIETARSEQIPVDIIFAIDSSGSMWESGDEIQWGLNELADEISSEGIDARIILLAATEENDCFNEGPSLSFCVEEPLGSGECGGGQLGFPGDLSEDTIFCDAKSKAGPGLDSNEPEFLHLNVAIDGTYPIPAIVSQYTEYRHNLREDAHKQVVIVEDMQLLGDAPGLSETFNTVLDPPMPPGTWTFNAVYCKTSVCELCDAAYSGGFYQSLVWGTGGVEGYLCEAKNAFEQLIDALAESVIINTPLSCEWTIPPPPDGVSFDKDRVNITYTNSGGEDIEYGKVEGDCGDKQGWKYDNEESPTKVMVCPATCDDIQSDLNGQIHIIFGCQTNVV